VPALLACVLLAGCAGSGPERGERDPDKLIEIPITTFAEPPPDQSIFQEYRIAPGDVLDVLYQARTWQRQAKFTLSVGNRLAVRFVHHQELNTEQRVRPDGTISLPYLGILDVEGQTVQDLTEELSERYREDLKEPDIYIVVTEFGNAIAELKRDLHTAPRGLSRLTTVRPDGFATFPMVGDVLVRNRTMTAVGKELNKAYDEIIPGMAVDLFLHEHAGRRIYVLGAVAKPGAYEISRPTTIVEAIALSSGSLDSANKEKVVVMRAMGQKMVGRWVNVEKSLELNEDGEFFFLQPDDIVYVPRRDLNRWAAIARDVADVIFFRGWSVGFSADYNLGGHDND
jgi:polysaccharide export outer membrane protein